MCFRKEFKQDRKATPVEEEGRLGGEGIRIRKKKDKQLAGNPIPVVGPTHYITLQNVKKGNQAKKERRKSGGRSL